MTRTKATTGTRRTIRLREFDYSEAGSYFVTICTWQRQHSLRQPGHRRIVQEAWRQLPSHFPNLALDEIVIMPDHIHFLITLLPASDFVAQGASRRAPTLGDIVRAFKGNAARRVNKRTGTPGAPLWQRNYYERVVRNEVEFEQVREYIRNNPLMIHTHEGDDLLAAWEITQTMAPSSTSSRPRGAPSDKTENDALNT